MLYDRPYKGIKSFSTTGIGSLPHNDPSEAVRLVIESFDIPFWPQLPALSFLEQMIPQYSEGMPGIRMDMAKEKVWIERDEKEIERFYERYGVDASIEISGRFSSGLPAFIREVSSRRFDVLKGQITGPLTFTLGLCDAGGKPVYFDEELREICLMLLRGKARYQIDALKEYADEVIIFIDEPILSALGSTSYMGVERAEALRLLKETVSVIKGCGAISGVHSCGRAEWPLLMEAGVDILNFDAYGYGDTIAIFPEETTAFLQSGGVLAWGIVPTLDAEALRQSTAESMLRFFNERLDYLSGKIPREMLLGNIMLTPSCGTGSRTAEETLKVFSLIRGLKEVLITKA